MSKIKNINRWGNFESDIANPFAPPCTQAQLPNVPDRLHSLALLAMIFNSFTLLYLAIPVFLNLSNGDQFAAPNSVVVFICCLMMFVPAIGLLGSWAMLKRRHYRLARLAAICMMTPLVGPCFGLTFPIGLWGLFFLNRKDTKSSFAGEPAQMQMASAILNSNTCLN